MYQSAVVNFLEIAKELNNMIFQHFISHILEAIQTPGHIIYNFVGNPPNYVSDDTIRVIIRSYKLNQPKGKITKLNPLPILGRPKR